VGKIDEDQLFYLTSRGIDEPSAKILIVEGFLKEVEEVKY
ncbi:MAG: Permease component of an ABC transporter complex, Fe-S cluster assembly, partial [Candidatus Collierbacteria bacterium GW2011_GWC2_44_30]